MKMNDQYKHDFSAEKMMNTKKELDYKIESMQVPKILKSVDLDTSYKSIEIPGSTPICSGLFDSDELKDLEDSEAIHFTPFEVLKYKEADI